MNTRWPAGRLHRFPFWGSPSLRQAVTEADDRDAGRSLPLLGKPFIEAH